MIIRAIFLLLSISSAVANAQVIPMPSPASKAAVRAVKDSAMVIQPGRARIEIFPTQRVEMMTDRAGTRVMTEKAANAGAILTADQPVLIFNHAYQQFGYATGEIAFKFKGIKTLDSVKASVPGAEAVGNQFYVVVVQTPEAILRVTNQLKARSDIDWVIPTVRYLPLASQARE